MDHHVSIDPTVSNPQPDGHDSYTYHGQQFQKSVESTPFSIHLHTPGELVITAVINNHIRKTLHPPLRYNVHDLPSAFVAHGRRKSQQIDDGLFSRFV
jgi:hypothetical protein